MSITTSSDTGMITSMKGTIGEKPFLRYDELIDSYKLT